MAQLLHCVLLRCIAEDYDEYVDKYGKCVVGGGGDDSDQGDDGEEQEEQEYDDNFDYENFNVSILHCFLLPECIFSQSLIK